MLNHAFVLKTLAAAALCAACAGTAQAVDVSVYNTAFFQPTPAGAYELNGFGRGDTSRPGLDAITAEAGSLLATQAFFDTWNINTEQLAPGNYQFTSTVVFATGSVLFSNVAFNSYDTLGHRNSVLFEISADRKQASGSGNFTVLSTCPVQSSVWIDVFGTQDLAVGQTGYGSNLVAQIPEPASYALLLGGLAALAGLNLRRRSVQG